MFQNCFKIEDFMQTSDNNSELRVTMVVCNKLEEIEVITIMGVLRISLVRQNSLFWEACQDGKSEKNIRLEICLFQYDAYKPLAILLNERGNMSGMITQLDELVSDWTTILRGFQLMDHTSFDGHYLSFCASR